MKKYLQLAALAVALINTACEKPSIDGEDADIGGNVHLSFVPTTADTRGTAAIGDYFSKINLQAFNEDGETVFDKVKTQTSDDPNFATIASAPFKANRVSDYSGPLFSAGGSMSLSLNGEWQDSYQGTW